MTFIKRAKRTGRGLAVTGALLAAVTLAAAPASAREWHGGGGWHGGGHHGGWGGAGGGLGIPGGPLAGAAIANSYSHPYYGYSHPSYRCPSPPYRKSDPETGGGDQYQPQSYGYQRTPHPR